MGGNADVDHDSDIEFGDSAASDLAEDNSSTASDNPWLQFTDTLTFGGDEVRATSQVIEQLGSGGTVRLTDQITEQAGSGGTARSTSQTVEQLGIGGTVRSTAQTVEQLGSGGQVRVSSQVIEILSPYVNAASAAVMTGAATADGEAISVVVSVGSAAVSARGATADGAGVFAEIATASAAVTVGAARGEGFASNGDPTGLKLRFALSRCCCEPEPTGCCPGGKPTGGFTAIVTGMSGYSDTMIDASTGQACYFDCDDLNGTHTFQTSLQPSDCIWSTTSPVNTVACDPVGLRNWTINWELSVEIIATVQHIRLKAMVANTSPETLVFDARVAHATACASIGGLIIELLGDQIEAGCCGVDAGSEAEIDAFA